MATVKRTLGAPRRPFAWLAGQCHLPSDPAQAGKGLSRQALAPKALGRSEVRLLLRVVELRQDVRAGASFFLDAFAGERVGDVSNLERADLLPGQRSGTVVFRMGKGVSSAPSR